jgi:hypothetical protein
MTSNTIVFVGVVDILTVILVQQILKENLAVKRKLKKSARRLPTLDQELR